MPKFNLSYDMRAPDFGTPVAKLYAEALEMAAYVDTRGFDYVTVMEHHGSDDGYLPTPFVMAAAIAARTKNLRLQHAAVLLPLHDPVKLAEQIAVTDIISNGRVDVVFGTGYVRSEFDMFLRSLKDRGKAMDEGIAIIQKALAGERFTAGGREICIRPLPVQKPVPIFLGGGVAATAKRAARFGVGLYPMNPDIVPIYKEECAKLGRKPGPVVQNLGWVHVSDDPDKTWLEVAPHVAHLALSYAKMAEGTSSSSPFEGMDGLEALKASGLYRVMTPEDCIKACEDADKLGGDIGLSPVIAGLDPKIGWKNIEMFCDKVMPHVKKKAAA